MVGDSLPRVPPRPFKSIQKVIIDKFMTTLSSCSKASADKAAVDLSVEVIEKFEEYWSQYGDCPLKGRNGILKGICPQVRRRADFHLRWYLQNLKFCTSACMKPALAFPTKHRHSTISEAGLSWLRSLSGLYL
jgi:hypothetical protein